MQTMTTGKYAGMTAEEITASLVAEELAAEKEADFRGFKVADLRVSFNAVQDPADWKNPIHAIVKLADVQKITVAVEFFTASPTEVVYTEPEIAGRERMAYIKARGYYLSMGS
jgi:hypothetical protein